MITLPLILILIGLFQTALIYWQHWSPFERESNLRAVLWGAPPAPRYWAVVALDLATSLLVALVVIGLWPSAPGATAAERIARGLPGYVVLALLAAVFHHWLNDTIIRFPRYGLIAGRLAILLIAGAALAAALLLAILAAVIPDLNSALAAWLWSLPAVLPAVVGLALAVFMLRALAFFLRVIPLAGSFLHATASTGLLIALLAYAGQQAGAAAGNVAWPGLAGLEGALWGTAVVALAALVLAWRLPGPERGADAVEPPPLVLRGEAEVPAIVAVTAAGATLTSGQVRVQVTRKPFTIRAADGKDQTLIEIGERGFTRDILLQKILSIPVLYTGNTIKMKWRLGGAPLGGVDRIEADGRALVVTCGASTLRLSFQSPGVLRLQVTAPESRALYNALSLTVAAYAGDHYLALGQRFNKVDQRGEETYFLVEEGGVGYAGLAPILKHVFGERGSFPNGEQCTGFPIPFLITSREQGPATGLFWNTYRPSWAALGRGGVTRVTVLDHELDLYLCAGPQPMDVIQQYTALNGQPIDPPAWVMLPWKTRTGPVTEDDVYEDIRRFRELQIPLAQVGIEHWQEIRGSYEFSKQWYPHIQDMVNTAHENGYRVTIWHFPYMNAGAATHREGVRRGYFLRNRLGLPYQQRIFHGIATVVDYSNPQAAAWHEGIVKLAFYDLGLHGAMTDYAESIPPDCVFYNGKSGLAMRNAYPVMYCQSMQRAACNSLGQDYVIYPRAGYSASQRYVNVMWPGDQDTDWDDGDGLPAAVRAMLNVSMCGFPVHGSDVGGWYDWFTPITTKELYLRWAEVGCYSPLMRAHGGPIGRNREPWKFDEETITIYRALSEEHVKLFPYLYTLALEAARTGIPIIRHPALVWPDRPEIYQVEDAWLIGDALYVAPVVRQGLTRREVILPPGEWWSLAEGRPVSGPARLTVDAPFGRVPLFLRRGALLPRYQEAFDTFGDVPSRGVQLDPHTARLGTLHNDLEVWLYPAEGSASRLTLFDGTELRAELRNGTLQATGQANGRGVTWKVFN